MSVQKDPARRRFAPIPIETTFERYRKTGIPAAELTPSPSSRSSSGSPPLRAVSKSAPPRTDSIVAAPPLPPAKEKRRFAPQLVESSVRRSHRVGDKDPAIRPTDRTDITPYTKNIYTPRSRKRPANNNGLAPSPRSKAAALSVPPHPGHRQKLPSVSARSTSSRRAPAAAAAAHIGRNMPDSSRRESCDDEVAGGVFDLVAREAQLKLHELALSAFPNSGNRAGGAEHYYVNDGSEDDYLPIADLLQRGRPRTRVMIGGSPTDAVAPIRARRDSSLEDMNWAFTEMRSHAKKLESERAVRAVRAADMTEAKDDDDDEGDRDGDKDGNRDRDGNDRDGNDDMGLDIRRSSSSSSLPHFTVAMPGVGRSGSIDRMATIDLDNMSIDSPPGDNIGLTRPSRQSLTGSPLWSARHAPESPSRTFSGLHSLSEQHRRTSHHYVRPESPMMMPTIGEQQGSTSASTYNTAFSSLRFSGPPSSQTTPGEEAPARPMSRSPSFRPIGETYMPYIPTEPLAPPIKKPMAAVPIPPDTGFRSRASPFRPRFPGVAESHESSLERARNLHRLRTTRSPALLGKNLTFRKCPSPKQTKLEPDHLYDPVHGGTYAEAQNRDPTEKHGLWHGYCYTDDQDQKLAPAERPAMLSTPMVPSTPREIHSGFTGFFQPLAVPGTSPLTGEPLNSHDQPVTMLTLEETRPAGTGNGRLPSHATPNHNGLPGAVSIRMLQGLQERLRREKLAADLEERIVAEFDDAFVTQVYNYLSLGYPALARQFDGELSKFSRLSVAELQHDDESILENLWGREALRGIGVIAEGSGSEDGDSFGHGSGNSSNATDSCPTTGTATPMGPTTGTATPTGYAIPMAPAPLKGTGLVVVTSSNDYDDDEEDGNEENGMSNGKHSQSSSSNNNTNHSNSGNGSKAGPRATGHIMLDREEKMGTREEDRCPRWKALKAYIFEWARQHPDLDSISPRAWGVSERRGSWGI